MTVVAVSGNLPKKPRVGYRTVLWNTDDVQGQLDDGISRPQPIPPYPDKSTVGQKAEQDQYALTKHPTIDGYRHDSEGLAHREPSISCSTQFQSACVVGRYGQYQQVATARRHVPTRPRQRPFVDVAQSVAKVNARRWSSLTRMARSHNRAALPSRCAL